jgi:HNH endonuclease
MMMAKKPSVPCSGGCGKLLWTGGQRAVYTKPECRACRRANGHPPGGPGRQSTPAEVQAARALERKRARYHAKRPEARRRTGTCAECGESVSSFALRCQPCNARAARERNRVKCAQRRSLDRGRKKKAGMSIFDLGNRDGWRCHLCRRRVDRALKAPDSGSPTFDHLIPVSDGGLDVGENLALAHLGCNVRRGAHGPAQLLLVA